MLLLGELLVQLSTVATHRFARSSLRERDAVGVPFSWLMSYRAGATLLVSRHATIGRIAFLGIPAGCQKLLPSFRHHLVELISLAILALQLGIQLLGFLREGLHEARIAHLAHEEVLEVARWVFHVELERVSASKGELLPFLGFGIYCGKGAFASKD